MGSILRPNRAVSYHYFYFPEMNYYLKRDDGGQKEIKNPQLNIFSFNKYHALKLSKNEPNLVKSDHIDLLHYSVYDLCVHMEF